MQNDIERILLSEEEIKSRVMELGTAIANDYAGKNPVMICILKEPASVGFSNSGSPRRCYGWCRLH